MHRPGDSVPLSSLPAIGALQSSMIGGSNHPNATEQQSEGSSASGLATRVPTAESTDEGPSFLQAIDSAHGAPLESHNQAPEGSPNIFLSSAPVNLRGSLGTLPGNQAPSPLSVGSHPATLPPFHPSRPPLQPGSTPEDLEGGSDDDNSPLLTGRPSSGQLPRRWIRKPQSAGRGWALGVQGTGSSLENDVHAERLQQAHTPLRRSTSTPKYAHVSLHAWHAYLADACHLTRSRTQHPQLSHSLPVWDDGPENETNCFQTVCYLIHS